MTWRNRLLSASFRGVAFRVEAEGESLGRRVATHEFAASEEVWREDIGRRGREVRVEGYLIGPDYDLALADLAAACEAPGAGRLSLPLRGEVSAICASFTYRRSKTAGGYAEFSATFLPAGQPVEPSAALDGRARVDASALEVVSASAASLAAGLAVLARSSVVVDETFAAVGGVVSGLEVVAASYPVGPVGLGAFQATAATIRATGAAGLADVAELAARISGLASGLTVAGASPAGQLDAALEAAAALGAPSDATPAVDNVAAVRRHARAALVAEAAKAAASAEPASYNDAVALRDRVASALERELVEAGDRGDDLLWLALRELRAEVVGDLTRRAATLAPLVEIAARPGEPLLVTAWRVYGDATRSGELAARNAIAHPGFAPVGRALEGLAP